MPSKVLKPNLLSGTSGGGAGGGKGAETWRGQSPGQATCLLTALATNLPLRHNAYQWAIQTYPFKSGIPIFWNLFSNTI